MKMMNKLLSGLAIGVVASIGSGWAQSGGQPDDKKVESVTVGSQIAAIMADVEQSPEAKAEAVASLVKKVMESGGDLEAALVEAVNKASAADKGVVAVAMVALVAKEENAPQVLASVMAKVSEEEAQVLSAAMALAAPLVGLDVVAVRQALVAMDVPAAQMAAIEQGASNPKGFIGNVSVATVVVKAQVARPAAVMLQGAKKQPKPGNEGELLEPQRRRSPGTGNGQLPFIPPDIANAPGYGGQTS